jgi:hypothetical protein
MWVVMCVNASGASVSPVQGMVYVLSERPTAMIRLMLQASEQTAAAAQNAPSSSSLDSITIGSIHVSFFSRVKQNSSNTPTPTKWYAALSALFPGPHRHPQDLVTFPDLPRTNQFVRGREITGRKRR